MYIYETSRISHGDSILYIARDDAGKALFVTGHGEAFDTLDGEITQNSKRCPLTNANTKIIRRLFPFTNPVSHKGRKFTIGLGDRLGLASAGHIRLIRDMDVFPVLAQQSIRELNLTGRTYEDVLSAAVWAVFQEGYTKGYGADGDHLKTREEVKMALDQGFTMITLDCSEHIPNGLEAIIKFAVSIYDEFIRGTDIDFELSIDETQTVTSPEDHRYVAKELEKANIKPVSLAPRFCGEFQKGIDYRGDVNEFEKEFAIHVQIAKESGYKISVHSGSDKFAVFPIIYRETDKNVHIKTAGTNWLEALRVIAQKTPDLFREIHIFALKNLTEAKKYYHTTENTSNIPDINTLTDEELPSLLDQDDARQVLHITYGLILSEKNNDGTSKFKDIIYKTLNEYEADYYEALEKHIKRHIFA